MTSHTRSDKSQTSNKRPERVGLNPFNNSSLTDKEQTDPKKLYKLFEEQFNDNGTLGIHRLELSTHKQQADEKTTTTTTTTNTNTQKNKTKQNKNKKQKQKQTNK